MEGDPSKGQDNLAAYGSDTSKASGQLSCTVLQQLDPPNRFATLEVWDSVAHYNAWQNDANTTKFLAKVTPLLGSPPDEHPLRPNLDGTGLCRALMFGGGISQVAR